jgi:hypothetical protein
MSRVTDYIDSLTPEECEKFKDVIDECLAREAEINKVTADMNQALNNLKTEGARMTEAMNSLLRDAERLSKSISLACLKVIPTSGRPQ